MARKPTELRPLMVRMPERLRARLEREASRSDRSMNTEIVRRLEASLSSEDAHGGPELKHIATMMAASFAYAGHAHNPKQPASRWINDPDAYAKAVAAVVEQLLLWLPADRDPAIAIQIFETVKRRIMTRWANERSKP